MTDLKFTQLPKTLLIALTFLGAYSNVPLANSSTLTLAESAMSDVSIVAHDRPSASRDSTSGKAIAQLLRDTSNPRLQSSNDGIGVQGVQNSQSEQRQSTGMPQGRDGAGTYAQDTPSRPPVGAPGGQRRSAGSRGTCPRVEQPLTALIPETSGYVLGATTAERPVFWFYVPYSLTPDTHVEFVLQDDDQHILYETSFKKSGTKPGVMGIELPPTAPALQEGKHYYWYFLVFCGDRDAPASVEGWVQRVATNPAFKRELEQATPQESVALYTERNIWFDAVTSLAQLRLEHPDDTALMEKWDELLKSVDLQAIAQAPIVECCTLDK